MPTILREGGYSVMIFTREPDEPAHVHVLKDRRIAKFWLAELEPARNCGYRAHEIEEIRRIIKKHRVQLMKRKSTEQNDICPDVLRVRFDQDSMIWDLEDGRSLSVPLSWYPSLMLATPAERADHFIIAYSAHWPSLGCSLDSEGILRGCKEAAYFATKAWKRHEARRTASEVHLTAA